MVAVVVGGKGRGAQRGCGARSEAGTHSSGPGRGEASAAPRERGEARIPRAAGRRILGGCGGGAGARLRPRAGPRDGMLPPPPVAVVAGGPAAAGVRAGGAARAHFGRLLGAVPGSCYFSLAQYDN